MRIEPVEKEEVIEVLNDINFNVEEGEVVAIVGPSGAGKSTILNLISELIFPSKGVVNVSGRIGYMFQRDNLFEWLTVLQNIKLGLKINSGKNCR